MPQRSARRARSTWTALFAAAALAVASSCGGGPGSQNVAAFPKSSGTSVEVAELDIRSDGIDRFVNCPPPGELGQDWIPPLPPWSPRPAEADVDGGAAAPTGPPLDDVQAGHGTPTERAVADTHDRFRACYNHGLVYDPTQDGHVAVVLRVGADGRVADVESWGACEIAAESIECMRDAARKLRFRPPAEGSETITIPAVFTSSGAVTRTSPRPNEVYTATAYVAVEALRPELHACEKSARQAGRGVIASATFNIDLDPHGGVVHSTVEPWAGDKDLLACAARVLGGLHLPPPTDGKGKVIVRLSFNPRSGSK